MPPRQHAPVGPLRDARQDDGARANPETEPADDHGNGHGSVGFHDEECRRVPSSPQPRKNQGTADRAEAALERLEREATPSGFFTDPLKSITSSKTAGNPSGGRPE